MLHRIFCPKTRRTQLHPHRRSGGGLLVVVVFLFLNSDLPGAVPEFQQYSAAIHVHSTFSNGEYEISQLARFAVERDLDVLVLTDSFLTTVTYGIWPFDRIGLEGINKMVRAGVSDYGVAAYFAAVEKVREEFPELVVIPGVEVTPYYYWKGAPWSDLTLYNFDRHLIVLGLTGQEIENLPLIENETWDNTPRDGSLLVAPLVLFFVAVSLLWVKRTKKVRLKHYTLARQQRLWGLALIPLLFSLLLAWNNYPFGELSDPYSGEHDTRPYQRVIDYVGEKGGVIYWSYPEARMSDVETGGARMVGRAHPEDLLLTDGYHGFEGIYGDRIQVTRPGETWDIALLEYLEGSRRTSPFVTTGIDFHYLREGEGWFELDGGQTLLLMPEKSEQAVLEALRQGRAYATFQGKKEKLRLNDFSLETVEGSRAIQGSTVIGASPIQVHIALDWIEGPPETNDIFRVQLIRNGEVVETLEQALPVEVTFEQALPAGRYYFRLRAVSGGSYQVLSNPIFVTID